MYKIIALLAVLYAGGAYGWHVYADTEVTTNWWVTLGLVGGGGVLLALWELKDMVFNFRLPQKKVGLNKARYHIDSLMRFALERDNKLMYDSLVTMNNEIFKVCYDKKD